MTAPTLTSLRTARTCSTGWALPILAGDTYVTTDAVVTSYNTTVEDRLRREVVSVK